MITTDCHAAWVTNLVPYAQALTPILVIIGWYIFIRDNKIRDVRKEARTLIDALEKKVAEIENIAYEYYRTSPEKSIELGAKIKLEIKYLSISIGILNLMNNKFCHVFDHLLIFRQSITGDDFEGVGRSVRDSSDPLYQNIAVSSMNLMGEMERAFAALYWQ